MIETAERRKFAIIVNRALYYYGRNSNAMKCPCGDGLLAFVGGQSIESSTGMDGHPAGFSCETCGLTIELHEGETDMPEVYTDYGVLR